MSFVTRFAPSPTGYLHLGHAFSAHTAWQAARNAGGRFLLRIEDTDQTRCRPEYETAVYEDLTWLGLDWEEPVRRQSDHLADYTKALDSLIARGLAYRCFKTRKEVAAAVSPGIPYTGAPLPHAEEAALLDADKPYAWRLSLIAGREALGPEWGNLSFIEETPDGAQQQVHADPTSLGDFVIVRKDTGTSYHLAGVHDEALQGITHVIRGQDLFEMTSLHVLLQSLLDLPTPIYRHHRLLTDKQGKKFAKSDHSKTIRAYREEGLSPADVIALFEQY